MHLFIEFKHLEIKKPTRGKHFQSSPQGLITLGQYKTQDHFSIAQLLKYFFLQIHCNERDEEINHLLSFKEGYQRLNEVFIERAAKLNHTGVDRFNSYEPKDPVAATKKVDDGCWRCDRLV